MAIKTLCGSCATLTSSVTNLMVLMILRGEPGWICLLVCSADILFSALVLHAITNKDHQGSSGESRSRNGYGSQSKTASVNAAESGIRISSRARSQECSIVFAETAFAEAQPNLAREIDTLPAIPEKSLGRNTALECREGESWIIQGSSRSLSTSIEVHYGIEQEIEQDQETNSQFKESI
ncbi:hypothetical protein TWF718_000392 [Orbilia javanica]|uniref:Transmembrane protein n=1 Tax=Orbilia javanica TaxID=47235 RepID=A0AAN8NC68_9PEZI